MTYAVRRATVNDLPCIMEIEHLAIKEALPVETVSLIMDNSNYRVWVCTVQIDDNDEILGYTMWQDVDNTHVISRLLVHPSCWNRGVGKMLIGSIIKDAEKCGNDCDFVCITDQAVMKFPFFLRSLGFKLERKAGIVSLYSFTGDTE